MPKGDKLTTSEYPSESSVPIDAHIKPPRNFPPMSKNERMFRKAKEVYPEELPRNSLYRGSGETAKADPDKDKDFSRAAPMDRPSILDKDRIQKARGVY